MNMLANVTLICGSSSRGVTNTENTPASNAAINSNAVISERTNTFAIAPDIPSFSVELPFGFALKSNFKYEKQQRFIR